MQRGHFSLCRLTLERRIELPPRMLDTFRWFIRPVICWELEIRLARPTSSRMEGTIPSLHACFRCWRILMHMVSTAAGTLNVLITNKLHRCISPWHCQFAHFELFFSVVRIFVIGIFYITQWYLLLLVPLACSHSHSHQLFTLSLNPAYVYKAKKCGTYPTYLLGLCLFNSNDVLGIYSKKYVWF